MARPGLVAALLLPLPFAALPLVAVLLGGPTFTGSAETAYAPITAPAIIDDAPAGLAKWSGVQTNYVDELRHGCDRLSAES